MLSSRGGGTLAQLLLDYAALVVVLAVLVAVFSMRSRGFFSYAQFVAIAIPNLPALVLAAGMTYVLIIGGIDLSVGSVMALSSAVIGVLFERYHMPLAPALLAGVGVGLLCGLFNGLVTITWKLPSFIVTLGMLQIARGLTHLITGSEQPNLMPSGIGVLARALPGGMPATFYIAILIVALGQMVLSWTVFGRRIMALGGNEEATRLSGIDVDRLKVGVFLISGFLASMAAILTLASSQFSDPNLGVDIELEVIAAVVVGGTSLMGGRGTVVGSLLGLLIIVVLGAGLVAMNVPDEVKRVVTGVVIVAAAILDYYRRKFASRQSI